MQALIDSGRERFQAVCEEQLDRNRLANTQYKRRCESALKKQAECKVDASRMFPAKVHAAYVAALAQGSTHQEASRQAKAQKNWGGITTE